MPRTRRHTHVRFGSINISELMDALKDALDEHGPEALVVFSSDYGDIGHTEQAHPLSREVEEVTLEESAYSRSGFAVRRDFDDEDESDDSTVPVLVIK
jgi:hypothetical protein